MTSHRISGRLAADRPRQKGWWGVPEGDVIEGEGGAASTTREPALRRPQPTRASHAVAQVGRALTPGQIAAIRAVMRIFVQDDMAHGVDARQTLFCSRCQGQRRAIGSVRYERLILCHECSTDYEITRARGLVELAAEYVERFPQRAVSA